MRRRVLFFSLEWGWGNVWVGISSGYKSVTTRSNLMHLPSHWLHYLFVEVICDGYLILSLQCSILLVIINPYC